MDILHLKITRTETVTTNAIVLFLEEINRQPVLYEAGQFLTFLINRNGKEIRRSYSFVTTPEIDKEMAIVIKRHINGEMSRYLFDHLKTGDVLRSLHPTGRFTLHIDPLSRRSIFFIAAGSGIAPVFSLLKKVLHFETSSRAILIYQNTNEASIIFKNELEALQHNFPERFVWINLLSNPIQKHHSRQRLNNILLEDILRSGHGFESSDVFYLCGPYAFMRMAQYVLKLMGIVDEQIRKENFVIDVLPPPPAFPDRSPKQVTLRWKGQVFRFTAIYPLNILQAALNHDIHLPYSCRGGRCSACTVKCKSGKVNMIINEVLTDKDLREGLVLTCVGYAETDLELEL